MTTAVLRPDTKGRISLGKLAYGVSGFAINADDPHHIVLTPLVEIPAREKWLFENPDALNRVQEGLKQASKGKLTSLGSFAQYLDEEP